MNRETCTAKGSGVMSQLRQVIGNPKFEFVIGLMLIVSAFFEMVETTLERWVGLEITTAYGIVLFAVCRMMHSMADMLEGGGHVVEAERPNTVGR